MKAAEVRFYIDADILGLGKLLGALRSDVTYPGDPGAVIHKRRRSACPVTMARTPVALAGPEARSTWDQLEVVMSQWRRIEELHGLPGPFIYTATRTTLSKVDLDV